MQSRNVIRLHRKRRIIASGTAERPRISVYRSSTAIYAQLIDDVAGKTLAAADSREVKGKKFNMDAAKETGKLLAKRAGEKGVQAVVFDRSGYQYTGKIKALAEGAREGGLKF